MTQQQQHPFNTVSIISPILSFFCPRDDQIDDNNSSASSLSLLRSVVKLTFVSRSWRDAIQNYCNEMWINLWKEILFSSMPFVAIRHVNNKFTSSATALDQISFFDKIEQDNIRRNGVDRQKCSNEILAFASLFRGGNRDFTLYKTSGNEHFTSQAINIDDNTNEDDYHEDDEIQQIEEIVSEVDDEPEISFFLFQQDEFLLQWVLIALMKQGGANFDQIVFWSSLCPQYCRGRTPLTMAILSCSMTVVKFLVDKCGVDPTMPKLQKYFLEIGDLKNQHQQREKIIQDFDEIHGSSKTANSVSFLNFGKRPNHLQVDPIFVVCTAVRCEKFAEEVLQYLLDFRRIDSTAPSNHDGPEIFSSSPSLLYYCDPTKDVDQTVLYSALKYGTSINQKKHSKKNDKRMKAYYDPTTSFSSTTSINASLMNIPEFSICRKAPICAAIENSVPGVVQRLLDWERPQHPKTNYFDADAAGVACDIRVQIMLELLIQNNKPRDRAMIERLLFHKKTKFADDAFSVPVAHFYLQNQSKHFPAMLFTACRSRNLIAVELICTRMILESVEYVKTIKKRNESIAEEETFPKLVLFSPSCFASILLFTMVSRGVPSRNHHHQIGNGYSATFIHYCKSPNGSAVMMPNEISTLDFPDTLSSFVDTTTLNRPTPLQVFMIPKSDVGSCCSWLRVKTINRKNGNDSVRGFSHNSRNTVDDYLDQFCRNIDERKPEPPQKDGASAFQDQEVEDHERQLRELFYVFDEDELCHDILKLLIKTHQLLYAISERKTNWIEKIEQELENNSIFSSLHQDVNEETNNDYYYYYPFNDEPKYCQEIVNKFIAFSYPEPSVHPYLRYNRNVLHYCAFQGFNKCLLLLYKNYFNYSFKSVHGAGLESDVVETTIPDLNKNNNQVPKSSTKKFEVEARNSASPQKRYYFQQMIPRSHSKAHIGASTFLTQIESFSQKSPMMLCSAASVAVTSARINLQNGRLVAPNQESKIVLIAKLEEKSKILQKTMALLIEFSKLEPVAVTK